MGEFSEAFKLLVFQLDSYVSKLNEQDKELRLLNATKDKFFSIIAHDLRDLSELTEL